MAIIVCAFFGFILLSSTVFFAIPPPTPQGMVTSQDQLTITGTPEDNYLDAQRPQFCGVAPAQSNAYVQEFEVDTPCTQPLGVVTAPDGGVWFAQTNTGNLARFDPSTETFQEFENPHWNSTQNSMMWGVDYDSGYIWYTDELHDSVWRFDISTSTYRQYELPLIQDSFPQTIQVDGTDIILNDLTANSLVVLDASDAESGLVYNAIPSNVTDAVTAGFALDRDGLIWYTTWLPQGGGILVGVDRDLLRGLSDSDPIISTLPFALRTPNGIAVDHGGNIWLADTSSSYFFMYDPSTSVFTHYVTSPPDPFSYGNATGVVGTPISRPYWMQVNDAGMIVFNEQSANRIGVMDPRTERLVEYAIPSRNPLWSDCAGDPLCGISQALSFTVDGPQVWFTQWVENGLGVVDTAVPLPIDVSLEVDRVRLSPGQNVTTSYTIISELDRIVAVEPVFSNTHTFLYIQTHEPLQLYTLDGSQNIPLDIVSAPNALPGTYKLLLGAETGAVSVSKFITVDIVP